MLKRFLPRQNIFFDLFQQSADILVLSATQFHKMLLDLSHQQSYVDAIANHEIQADHIADQTFVKLHKTFITPFDRHDIHQFTSKLDDILDLINRCAQRFPHYDLKEVPAQLIELSELNTQCTQLLQKAIYQLNSLKKAEEIFQYCRDLDLLEGKANKLVLSGEKELFLEDIDFKKFAKLREIYSRLKSMINACQDLGNIIKGIVLEYS